MRHSDEVIILNKLNQNFAGPLQSSNRGRAFVSQVSIQSIRTI